MIDKVSKAELVRIAKTKGFTEAQISKMSFDELSALISNTEVKTTGTLYKGFNFLDPQSTQKTNFSGNIWSVQQTSAASDEADLGFVRTQVKPQIDQQVENPVISAEQAQDFSINQLSQNTQSALNLFLAQERDEGLVSKGYDEIKNTLKTKLSSTRINKAIDNEITGLNFLSQAKDQTLTKREYYEQNKQRLPEMIPDFATLSEAQKQNIKARIDSLPINEIKEFQHKIAMLPNKNKHEYKQEYKQEFSAMLAELKSSTETPTLKKGGIEGQQFKTKMKVNKPNTDMNSEELISYEEVFKYERGVEYSKENIQNFEEKKAALNFVSGAKQKYEQLKQNADDIDVTDTNVLKIYTEYFGDSKKAQAFLQNVAKENKLNIQINLNPNGGLTLNSTDKSTLKSLLKGGVEGQEAQLNKVLNGKSYEQYQTEYATSYTTAYGTKNAEELAKAYGEDQENINAKATGAVQIAGMGSMVIGGVACLIPGAQPIGAGMISVGGKMALGGMVAKTALDVVNESTRKNGMSDEAAKAIIKEAAINAGSFVVGMGAGATGAKVGASLLANGSSKLVSVVAERGVDFTISVLGDMAMIGNFNVEGNMMGVVTATAMGLKTGKNVMKNHLADEVPTAKSTEPSFTSRNVINESKNTSNATKLQETTFTGKVDNEVNPFSTTKEEKTDLNINEKPGPSANNKAPKTIQDNLVEGLNTATSREDFVIIRDEIKKMQNSQNKTNLIEAYQKKYQEWSNKATDIRMEYKPDETTSQTHVSTKEIDKIKEIINDKAMTSEEKSKVLSSGIISQYPPRLIKGIQNLLDSRKLNPDEIASLIRHMENSADETGNRFIIIKNILDNDNFTQISKEFLAKKNPTQIDYARYRNITEKVNLKSGGYLNEVECPILADPSIKEVVDCLFDVSNQTSYGSKQEFLYKISDINFKALQETPEIINDVAVMLKEASRLDYNNPAQKGAFEETFKRIDTMIESNLGQKRQENIMKELVDANKLTPDVIPNLKKYMTNANDDVANKNELLSNILNDDTFAKKTREFLSKKNPTGVNCAEYYNLSQKVYLKREGLFNKSTFPNNAHPKKQEVIHYLFNVNNTISTESKRTFIQKLNEIDINNIQDDPKLLSEIIKTLKETSKLDYNNPAQKNKFLESFSRVKSIISANEAAHATPEMKINLRNSGHGDLDMYILELKKSTDSPQAAEAFETLIKKWDNEPEIRNFLDAAIQDGLSNHRDNQNFDILSELTKKYGSLTNIKKVLNNFKADEVNNPLKDYLIYYDKENPKFAKELYERMYLSKLPENSREICKKISDEMGTKVFLSDVKDTKGAKYVYNELSTWLKASKGQSVMPPIIDFSLIKASFIDEVFMAAGFARSDKHDIHVPEGEFFDLQHALRHELMHANDKHIDTKSGILDGVNIDEIIVHKKDADGYIIKNPDGTNTVDLEKCKYVQIFRDAGISESQINYAYTNKSELLAVAAEGNTEVYNLQENKEFKQTLMKLGMPEWFFNIKGNKFKTTAGIEIDNPERLNAALATPKQEPKPISTQKTFFNRITNYFKPQQKDNKNNYESFTIGVDDLDRTIPTSSKEITKNARTLYAEQINLSPIAFKSAESFKSFAEVNSRIKDYDSLIEKAARRIENINDKISKLSKDKKINPKEKQEAIAVIEAKKSELINDYNTFKKSLQDTLGSRIVFKDTSEQNINRIVNELIRQIDTGELKLLELENYYGEGTKPYFNSTQIKKIQLHCKNAGYEVKIVSPTNAPKGKDAEFLKKFNSQDAVKNSGYTTTQIIAQYKNGAIQEIQFRGESINDLAEAEHVLYNAKNNKVAKVEDVKKALKTVEEMGLQKTYDEYIRKSYVARREFERTGIMEMPELTGLPAECNKILSVENLIKLNKEIYENN